MYQTSNFIHSLSIQFVCTYINLITRFINYSIKLLLTRITPVRIHILQFYITDIFQTMIRNAPSDAFHYTHRNVNERGT